MVDGHVVRTSEYLLDVQSVLHAGQLLRHSLSSPPSRRERAITQLEQAASRQEAGGKTYQAFMFSQLAVAPESGNARRDRIAEDALSSIVTDLDVANVLLASGRALGENGQVPAPSLLDDALMNLGQSISTVGQSPPAQPEITAGLDSAGSTETSQSETSQSSTEKADPIGLFKSSAVETLELLVSESQLVVTDVVKLANNLDPHEFLNAIGRLGDAGAQLPKIGRLIQQGLRKLQSALNALVQLLGSNVLTQIRERVDQIWMKLNRGDPASEVLQWTYGVASMRTRLAALSIQGLDPASLAAGSEELVRLQTQFKEQVGLLRGAAAAVSLLGAIVVWGGWIGGPQLAMATASAIVLILATTVLIGMDYADSGSVLRLVRGVGEIVGGLRPSHP